jgi:hypothetical protein
MLKRTAAKMAQTKLRIGYIPGKRKEQSDNHRSLPSSQSYHIYNPV